MNARMTHFAFTHEFATDADRYWAVFFDDAYNRELRARLDIARYTLLDRHEDDASITYAQQVVPRRQLPPIVRRIAGGDLGYVERATFHKRERFIDVTIEPTLFKERTDVHATYRVETIAPGRVRRTYEGDVHVDFPLIARTIETAVLEDVRRSFDIAATVTRKWLQ